MVEENLLTEMKRLRDKKIAEKMANTKDSIFGISELELALLKEENPIPQDTSKIQHENIPELTPAQKKRLAQQFNLKEDDI